MMTPAAQITDATAFKHTGTLYILWVSMKMDVSTALKLILSKMAKPSLIMSPWIHGIHMLLL
jgi:GH43 family beta-xylosidase